jgi:hypothetical protein
MNYDNPLHVLIQHHRLRDFQVIHCDPPIPVIRRCENLPETVSLCRQIFRVLKHTEPFSTTDLLFAAFSFREEYPHPPSFLSIEYIKDLFYHWIVATLTYTKRQEQQDSHHEQEQESFNKQKRPNEQEILQKQVHSLRTKLMWTILLSLYQCHK